MKWKGSAMEAVWDRADDTTDLPQVVTVQWLRELGTDEFAETLRGNLLPRAGDPGGRRSWQTLWRLLADWPDLQERAQEALSGFLSAAEADLRTNPGTARPRPSSSTASSGGTSSIPPACTGAARTPAAGNNCLPR